VTITDCDFEDTQAGSSGGAVSASGGSVTITGCDFEDTRAGSDGGAVLASGDSVSIRGYTSNNTKANERGGSLLISGGHVSVTNASISNSRIIGGSENYLSYTHGGGGIWVRSATAEFTDIEFTNVMVQGTVMRAGGAVLFNHASNTGNMQLTMTDCSIDGASAPRGGAIAGFGPSTCVLSGVSFANCAASLDPGTGGSLLYGDEDPYPYSYADGAPAYTVKPGCKVEGTEITASNWSTILTPSMLYLINGSTIIFAP
jgi:hypothetical protein